ncbi:hypothetical protein [Kribbella monticola]|uniref:hypothetical protein n=1 Tax=Kribbella monticola TaxID=2185285 RepID=UPI000DD38FB1|nr:hypothetical protein [Kribbella monticola]
MPKQILMTGPAWVHYGQIYVGSPERQPQLPESFGGQQNGLCGAAVPGTLILITGLHTGTVGFAVELYDEEPLVDDEWEEIVEASYRPLEGVALTGWGGEGRWPLALAEIDYRVRYCGWGMDTGHQTPPQLDEEPLVDRYLLQFWPALPEPDRIIKQTSAQAAYWHHERRKTPPPPTPEQRAERERERERQQAEDRLAEELRGWGGRPPSDRLREIWKAYHLALDHRDLLDALEAASPDKQRAMVRWMTRRTCHEAGLDRYEWVTAALDRIERGDDPRGALQIPAEAFGPGASDGPHAFFVAGWSDNLELPAKVMTIFSPLREDDPLRATIDALWVARDVFGPNRTEAFVGELRQAFLPLG